MTILNLIIGPALAGFGAGALMAALVTNAASRRRLALARAFHADAEALCAEATRISDECVTTSKEAREALAARPDPLARAFPADQLVRVTAEIEAHPAGLVRIRAKNQATGYAVALDLDPAAARDFGERVYSAALAKLSETTDP